VFGYCRTATISGAIAKKQAARVLDLSSSRRLRCVVDHGLAYEAILCLALLTEAVPASRFERAAEVRKLWANAPASSKKAYARLRGGKSDVWAALLGLVREAEAPRDMTAFARRLRSLDPLEVKLAVVGHHAPEFRAVVEPALYRAAAGGDAAAIRQFAHQTRHVNGGPGRAALMKLPADEMVDDLIECLLGMSEKFDTVEPDWSGRLEQSAAEASRVAAHADVRAVVERMTHGLVYNGDVGIVEVLVVPSLVHRPFTVITDHEATKIFCYPAAYRPAQEVTPDARLVAIYRALGDETRLRILRRLVNGSTSVGLLSEDLGLAKSTVHQHLFSLRSAGLVRLDLKTGYELTTDLPDLNGLLKEFLGKEAKVGTRRGMPLTAPP
jgi:DNA-binding transcriptional ArsR family regulator